MNVIDFISHLRNLGVKLALEDSRLRCHAPNGVMNAELLEKLKEMKPAIIKTLEEAAIEHSSSNLEPQLRPKKIPLTFSQNRLWFLFKMEGPSATYNVPLVVEIKGNLDKECLEKSILAVLERHEVLRTFFAEDNGVPYQIVDSNNSFVLRLENADCWQQAEVICKTELAYKFDLSAESLFRAKLVAISPNHHILIINIHHILTDAWSNGIVLRDLSIAYKNLSAGFQHGLEILPIQYADFAIWQNQPHHLSKLKQQSEYWKLQLAEIPTLHQLPILKERPDIQKFSGSTYTKTIPIDVLVKLKHLANEQGVTLFIALYSCITVLLSRLSGETDIVIGSPDANRTLPELQDIVGFFINTLVLRSDLSGNPSFSSLLQKSKKVFLDAYKNKDLPFEKLVEIVKPERSLKHAPICQIAFGLNNTPSQKLNSLELEIAPVNFEGTVAKLDMTIDATEVQNGLAIYVEYSNELFDHQYIAAFIERLETLISLVVEAPEKRICDYKLLTFQEELKLINRDRSEQNDLINASFFEDFERIATDNPEKIAVSYGKNCISYAELKRLTDQVAYHLIEQGACAEVVVGISIPRSIDMIVGLMGILKSGAAYLPLDPEYPSERLQFMLDVSLKQAGKNQSVIVLYSGIPPEFFIGKDVKLLDVAALRGAYFSPIKLPEINLDNLAYTIFTSGSTGVPKGIQITHRGLKNLAIVQNEMFNISKSSRVLQFASLNFDASVSEILTAITAGACLCLANADELGASHKLEKLFNKEAITHVTLPPSLLTGLNPEMLPYIECIVSAGEKCWMELIIKWSKHVRLVNAYGPSELSVCASMQNCNPTQTLVTVGCPIANTRTYILDESMNLNPPGCVGELYVDGAGLARGYSNPRLTAERFLPNPFSSEPGRRMFRTGDKCQLTRNGEIEYIGRLDAQIKIRGCRIEVGEIEVATRLHPEVSDVVVVTKNVNGAKSLSAYIIALTSLSENNKISLIQSVSIWLGAKLPLYMRPTEIVVLDSFPLTLSGKVDRKNLSLRLEQKSKNASDLLKPRNNFEKKLCSIWKDILQVDEIGIHDNFFDLGGYSALTILMQKRISSELEVEVTVVDLFTYPTISSLSFYLGRDEKEKTNLLDIKTPESIVIDNEIAVIGYSCRFPDANNADEFWDNIKNGKESVRFFDKKVLADAGVDQKILNKENYVNAGILLEDIDLFDAGFFDMTPKEAEIMDPQQRLLLEIAVESLDHAGYPSEKYGGKIGSFIGKGESSYLYYHVVPSGVLESVGQMTAMILNGKEFSSTQISYKLDLHGPSVVVGSACSTSLLAVHQACNSLRLNQCNIALAGGANIDIFQPRGYLHEAGSILSSDGHCRAFSDKADGTIGGSGAGLVVLKRLADALRDGDTIHAIIKGSAVNNDGANKVGYTAPSTLGQAKVIAQAHLNAGVEAASIQYIETHGTATQLGDPIEIDGLSKAFVGLDRNTFSCAIGSVKTNVGHLDAAAGVCGLIKTIQALKHQTLPPSLHYESGNPKIDFANLPFYVNTHLRPWERLITPRRAGVSSFGIGGTNVHCVLEEAPPSIRNNEKPSGYQLLVLSAKTTKALERMKCDLSTYLVSNPHVELADVAYTLQCGRREFNYRDYIVCESHSSAISLLDENLSRAFHSQHTHSIIFMFPGQGVNLINAAKDLYDHEHKFRSILDVCANFLSPIMNLDIRSLIYDGESNINSTSIYQPILFSIEYSLGRYLMDLGINPNKMIGHSLGEYACACLAGVIKLEDALTLVVKRGQLMESTPLGEMLVVSANEKDLDNILVETNCDLAAINSPHQLVISGSPESIAAAKEMLLHKKFQCKKLNTTRAFHSRHMDFILDEYRNAFKNIKLTPQKIPFISNVTGTWITQEEAVSSHYWVNHLRSTVLFNSGLDCIHGDGNNIFLEVGPGAVLSDFVRSKRLVDPAYIRSIMSATEQLSGYANVLESLGAVWALGGGVQWTNLYSAGYGHRIPLPGYPFDKKRYWIDRVARNTQISVAQGVSEADHNETKLYTEDWEKIDSIWLSNNTSQSSHQLIVFSEREGIDSCLDIVLSQSGCNVVWLKPGGLTRSLSERSFEIDLQKKESLFNILREIGFEGNISVLYLNFGSADTAIIHKSEGNYFSNDFECFVQVIKQINHLDESYCIQANVVASGMFDISGDDYINPKHSVMLGISKCLAQEGHNINLRSVDLTADAMMELLSKNSNAKNIKLAKKIISLLDNHNTGQDIAIRADSIWKKTYCEINAEADHRINPLTSLDNEVYVITGGLGNIGSALALHLHQKRFAKLILVGRTNIPDEKDWELIINKESADDNLKLKVRKLKFLKQMGVAAEFIQADVANMEQMDTVFSGIHNRYGKITGVIHAAADLGSVFVPIMHINEERIRNQFQAKVQGLLNIDVLGNKYGVGKCIAMSSVASVLGGVGYSVYAASNIFMDIAVKIFNRESLCNWVSINWDGWDFHSESMERKANASGALTIDEALKSFDFVSCRIDRGQVIVAKGALHRRVLEITKPSNAKRINSEVAASKELPIPINSDMQSQIKNIWIEVIGVADINITDNFFELGGDSLLAIRLVDRVQEIAACKIDITEFMGDPTIAKILTIIEIQNKISELEISSEKMELNGEKLENALII